MSSSMPNNVAASSAFEFSPSPEKSHSTKSKSALELKKRHDTMPLESIKCSTKLLGSVKASHSKVDRCTSFRPPNLRPCSNSLKLRSSATSRLGYDPNEANTPPVHGFISVTHITGNFPPSDASFTSTGK